jgi:hypothetical protein
MTEKRLWGALKEGLDHAGHFDRIESHAVSQGRPDVNYCIDGREGDIELKIFDRKRGGFILRSSQNAWFCNRVRSGSTRCFILARYDADNGRAFYLLIDGKNSRALIHDRSYEGWLKQARTIWEEKINWSELKAALKGTG